jgi:hypothetical protein
MMPIMDQWTMASAVFGQTLVVVVQAAAGADPGQRSFDDPAAGQDLEGVLPGGFLDDLDDDPAQHVGEGDEFAAAPESSPHPIVTTPPGRPSCAARPTRS